MSKKSNINNLFRERFENFEIVPDEIIWENIESKLLEKKKRRVIPFWWKLSGIAASLLIGFLIYNLSKTNLNTKESIVNQNKNEINTSQIIVSKKTEVAISEKEISNSEISNNLIRKDEINIKNNATNSSKSKNAYATSAIKLKKNSEEKIALQTEKATEKKASNYYFEKNNTDSINSSESEKQLASNSSNEKNNNSLTSNRENKELNVNQENETLENIKKIDSTKIASVEHNALEELLNEKESKPIKETKLNRWQVSSNVAPIYFSSISNGSPLDEALKNNDKAYSANNQSYGIGVNYTLTKKMKIRTGINLLNVDYNTNGIVYYQNQSVNGKLSHLNPNMMGNSIIIENVSNVNTPFNKMIEKSEGSLNQKLGYIEMPLEMTYSILNKRLGIDFIGGMSTMILNKNEIYLQSSELNLKIGEANNLNNVHLSGNIGLGFKYGIIKHLDARIEPIFKYQINTFSNDSGNFKPYLFGVYSGLNFTF